MEHFEDDTIPYPKLPATVKRHCFQLLETAVWDSIVSNSSQTMKMYIVTEDPRISVGSLDLSIYNFG